MGERQRFSRKVRMHPSNLDSNRWNKCWRGPSYPQMSVPHSRYRVSARLRWLLLFLGATVAFGLVAWPPLEARLLNHLLRSAEVPSREMFEEVLRMTARPADVLGLLWATGRIAHRRMVADHLNRAVAEGLKPGADLEELVLEGTLDCDASVRELSMGTLAALAHPSLGRLARVQLRDHDPQIRLLGLQHIARGKPDAGIPVVMTLLRDPDLRVVTSADAALRKWTGIDSGIRIHHAIPKRDENHREVLDEGALEAIREGVRRRLDWWAGVADEYSADAAGGEVVQSGGNVNMAVSDFALPDLSGATVRLSDFRGRHVLLNFWTTWCTSCLTEIPDLNQLQAKYAERLVILGVSLDGVPDSHGHAHAEGHPESDEVDGNESHSGHVHQSRDELVENRARVSRVARQRDITYRVLLDPKNVVGGRFNGGELPTNVLIDSAGRVRRRFVGARALPVWDAMIAELDTIAGSFPRSPER